MQYNRWLVELSSDGNNHKSSLLSQVISLFTLVEVQLKGDGAAMKYGAVLKRPEESKC